MKSKDGILNDFNLDELFPHDDEASCLVVTCPAGSYCASEICRAVEDCDARVVNLNVTSRRTDDDRIVVSLRINRRNAESVSRSLRRFGYVVEGVENGYDADDLRRARDRANELIRYLEI